MSPKQKDIVFLVAKKPLQIKLCLQMCVCVCALARARPNVVQLGLEEGKRM